MNPLYTEDFSTNQICPQSDDLTLAFDIESNIQGQSTESYTIEVWRPLEEAAERKESKESNYTHEF